MPSHKMYLKYLEKINSVIFDEWQPINTIKIIVVVVIHVYVGRYIHMPFELVFKRELLIRKGGIMESGIVFKRLKASLTVEAALVIPIVLCVGITFLYVINIIQFRVEMYDAMSETADMVAKYAYTYEKVKDGHEELLNSIGNPNLALSNVYLAMKDKVDSKIVAGGLLGISLLESDIDMDKHDVRIVAKYKVTIPFLPGDIFEFKQQLCVHTAMFAGTSYKSDSDEKEDDKEQYVYITAKGKVYHTHSDCTYLGYKISSVSGDELASKRNLDGGKYYPCENCCGKSAATGNSTYYICSYGNRYHSTLGCGSIERNATKVRLSEVKGMKECAKCAGR